MSPRRVIVAEHVALREAAPEYMARAAAERVRRRKERQEFAVAEAPMVSELRSVGVLAESVWDLVNRPNDYDIAIPILLRHLEISHYPLAVRSGIARSLAVPGARCCWDKLVELYRAETKPLLKDSLACAVGGAATRAHTLAW